MKILIETSARHVHLSQDVKAILFGEKYEFTVRNYLSQPGQFVCAERVNIVSSGGEIKNVAILGPERRATQVEVSITDAMKLGISPPIRESGKLKGSEDCRIIGPNGEYFLNEGVIAAKRHIHMTPEDAERLLLRDTQVVSVKVLSQERSVIFGDVIIRVSPEYSSAMHIDTDEANSAGISGRLYGEILLSNI